MELLSDLEQDQLKEAINVGVGNASVAIGKMVGSTVTHGIPSIFVGRVEEVIPFLGNSEDIITAVMLKFFGDISGVMLFQLPEESIADFTHLLTKREVLKTDLLDEFDCDALSESGNITAGYVFNALSDLLHVRMLQSVPSIATDMLGAVVSGVLAEIGAIWEELFVFRVDLQIKTDPQNINAHIFFLLDPDATTKTLDLIKKKFSNTAS